MTEFIKYKLREYLLKEEMKSTLDSNFTEKAQHHNLILVATDNENDKEHYLILGVDLVPEKDYFELGYGFSLMNKDLKLVSHYLRTRTEVEKYFPIDLKGKITPIVLEISKNLINKNKPNKIYMETYEEINNDNDSFKRFENIANFITSLGYKMIDGYPKRNDLNKFEWMFINSNGVQDSITEDTLFERDEYNKLNREERNELRHNMIFEDKEFLREWLINGKITRTDINN